MLRRAKMDHFNCKLQLTHSLSKDQSSEFVRCTQTSFKRLNHWLKVTANVWRTEIRYLEIMNRTQISHLPFYCAHTNCIDQSLMEAVSLNKWPIKEFTHRIQAGIIRWVQEKVHYGSKLHCVQKKVKGKWGFSGCSPHRRTPPHDPQQRWTRNTLQTAETQKQLACWSCSWTQKFTIQINVHVHDIGYRQLF